MKISRTAPILATLAIGSLICGPALAGPDFSSFRWPWSSAPASRSEAPKPGPQPPQARQAVQNTPPAPKQRQAPSENAVTFTIQKVFTRSIPIEAPIHGGDDARVRDVAVEALRECDDLKTKIIDRFKDKVDLKIIEDCKKTDGSNDSHDGHWFFDFHVNLELKGVADIDTITR